MSCVSPSVSKFEACNMLLLRKENKLYDDDQYFCMECEKFSIKS